MLDRDEQKRESCVFRSSPFVEDKLQTIKMKNFDLTNHESLLNCPTGFDKEN